MAPARRPNAEGASARRLLRRVGSALALAGLLASCASEPARPERILIESPGVARRAVHPAFLPAFDALQAAVDDGEDELARRILAGILARRPPAGLIEFARGYERILDGRAVLEDLELRLVSEAVGGSDRDFRLVLEASHGRASELVLHLPPTNLRHIVVGIDPHGGESRHLSTEVISALAELTLPPGEVLRHPILDYELTAGGALAVRERWSLEPRAGEVEVDGRWLPAQNPRVAPAERTVLASFLPRAPVEPAELVRYAARPEAVHMPPLIERTVRIDPERREEALDLLAPLVADLAEADPERLETIAPALRWLSRSVYPGTHPQAWADWFAARRTRSEEIPAGGLVLPEEGRAR